MTNLNGTRTKENLLIAFAGESQARNKYTFFASVAKKEGYQSISAIFEETANHEKEHAKRLFKFLQDGDDIEIKTSFPAGKIGTTIENLESAINGEHEETSVMYPEFAKIAREEGFENIAIVFENIGKAELYHKERYAELLKGIEGQNLLKKNHKVLWKCTNCGFHIVSEEAPLVCPACNHSQGYFIEINEKLF